MSVNVTVFLQRLYTYFFGLFFYLIGISRNIPLVTSHCNFILFVLEVYLLLLYCFWENTGHSMLVLHTQIWVFWELRCSNTLVHIYLCHYKFVHLYCMLFLSLFYTFMLLPQPILHNANTNETDTRLVIVHLISGVVEMQQCW